MYLVIKRENKYSNSEKEHYLKLYQSLDKAVDFVKSYVSESSVEWNRGFLGHTPKKKINYYRFDKKGTRSKIFIKYIKNSG